MTLEEFINNYENDYCIFSNKIYFNKKSYYRETHYVSVIDKKEYNKSNEKYIRRMLSANRSYIVKEAIITKDLEFPNILLAENNPYYTIYKTNMIDDDPFEFGYVGELIP